MNIENKVTKANALVMARYNSSLEEFRIACILISLVQPEDEDFKPYTFRIAEFMKLLWVDTKTKYTDIPKITEKLMKRIIKIRDDKWLLQVSWLSSADYKFGEGVVELQFDPKLKPYLLGLKERFVTYGLENILRLRSMYSGRLYEIMKSNEYRQTYEIKVNDLIEMFELGKSYSDFHEIRRRIIEPAKAELDEKTDICFTYEEVKNRKKVVALKFHIRANLKNKKKQC